MHILLDSFFTFPGFLPPPVAGVGSLSGGAAPYLGAGPGSRRDPPPYIYSHKFAQLSPRSNTHCLRRTSLQASKLR